MSFSGEGSRPTKQPNDTLMTAPVTPAALITIIRTEKPDKTPGEMLLSGNHFGWTLEDKARDLNADGDLDDPGEGKVYGQTAIPYGRYRVIVSYSNRFKKQMIQLVNVRGQNIKFGTYSIDAAGIRIHGGNTVADTLGCPLLGLNRKENGDVYNCKDINETLVRLVQEADKEGEVYCDIIKKQGL